MPSNRLQLNTVKTEVIWCASNRRQHQLPQVTLRVCTDHVTPTTSVRDLGIYVKSMRTHVSRTVPTVQLLCCTTPAAEHSSVCVASSTTVAGAVPSGLWQRNACRSTWKPASELSLNSLCSCSAVCMVRLRRTWRTSCVVWRTSTQEDGCVLRQRLLS